MELLEDGQRPSCAPIRDGRVDIYASGCVAYWLLTGQLVFTADTTMALLLQHVHAAPAAPSLRAEQPMSAELDQLVLSCLSKDPGKRPQSARELGIRLGEIQGAIRGPKRTLRHGGPRISRRD
jgi:serine/threonine protein kinase